MNGLALVVAFGAALVVGSCGKKPPSGGVDDACTKDDDCVVTTFSGNCCSCCPVAPHAANARQAEISSSCMGSVKCASPCPDNPSCEATEPAAAFVARCRDRRCVSERKRQ